MVQVTMDGEVRSFPEGTSLAEVMQQFGRVDPAPILALEDNQLRELIYRVNSSCTVRPLTMNDPDGLSAYLRTAQMIMHKAFKDVCPSLWLTVMDILPEGILFKCKGGSLTSEQVSRVSQRMHQLVEEDHPLGKESVPMDEAMPFFREQGMRERERLFHYRRSSFINLYSLWNFRDYYYGYMANRTGVIKWFLLRQFQEGVLLSLPGYGLTLGERGEVTNSPLPRGKMFEAKLATYAWAERLNMTTVGAFNDQVSNTDYSQLMLVQEAAVEARVAEVARKIAESDAVRFVLIAGPSSSGKTTFSHRLSVQLEAMGKRPHPIALDNYYCNREDTPLDEFGEKDYECLEAVDIQRFNSDLTKLLNGETVEPPYYNFVTGKREFRGERLKLYKDDLLVIEGIHGLNDALSYLIPRESQFRIYISAMSALAIDEHNVIFPSDMRLIRRLVRDARSRGISARETIARWESVRRGEEKNIFPFREKADAIFDSSTRYELSALKVYAEPLLFGIRREDPEFVQAKRLLKFLDYVLPIPADEIPQNSILREFIGGSCFRV